MTVNVTPGPDAHRAFRLGMIASGILGLFFIGLLYWAQLVSLSVLGFMLVFFPMYLLVAASVFSVWLGFDKDATDLRPAYRERKRT